jgi:hypothetical protein
MFVGHSIDAGDSSNRFFVTIKNNGAKGLFFDVVKGVPHDFNMCYSSTSALGK